MNHVQEIQRLRVVVAKEEKLIEDFEFMQNGQQQLKGFYQPTTYAMWAMIEQCACFAERRKNKASLDLSHSVWIRDRSRR